MTELFDEVLSDCDKIFELNNYVIEIGLKNNNDYILITSGPIQYQLPLDNALYMIENGSLSTSGLHIFNHIINWVNIQLQTRFELITDKIISGGNISIPLEMQNLENLINIYLSNFFGNYNQNLIFTLPEDNQILYPVDLKIFKNKVQCKIYKKII